MKRHVEAGTRPQQPEREFDPEPVVFRQRVVIDGQEHVRYFGPALLDAQVPEPLLSAGDTLTVHITVGTP